MKCQATIDDWDNLRGHFPMQRLSSPGTKPCTREEREVLGKLHLCNTHARMAREGLLSEEGRVASTADITNVRRYPSQFPYGLHRWAIILDRQREVDQARVRYEQEYGHRRRHPLSAHRGNRTLDNLRKELKLARERLKEVRGF